MAFIFDTFSPCGPISFYLSYVVCFVFCCLGFLSRHIDVLGSGCLRHGSTDWREIAVVIVSDGREKANASTKKYAAKHGPVLSSFFGLVSSLLYASLLLTANNDNNNNNNTLCVCVLSLSLFFLWARFFR